MQIAGFRKTKPRNTEVRITLGDRKRSQDCKLRDVQKNSSELAKQLVPSKQLTVDSFDVKMSLTFLKNALFLASELHESIQQLRRNLIK